MTRKCHMDRWFVNINFIMHRETTREITLADSQKLIESLNLSKDLWGHQLHAFHLARRSKRFAFLFEQGCGKTLTAISCLLAIHKRLGRTPRTLILCPIIVKTNWLAELRANAPHEVFNRVQIVEGSREHKIAQIKNPVKSVFIMNYEQLHGELFNHLLHKEFDICIADEFHKLKDPHAARTKCFFKITRNIKVNNAMYIYALTGTPILNGPLDSYTLLKAMGVYNQSLTQFRLEYFEDVNANVKATNWYFPNFKPKPSAIPALNALLARCSYRVTKAECLDLPPLVRQTYHVELTTEQRRIYEDMRKHFVADLYCDEVGARKTISADIAITKTLRMQQICSGVAVYDATTAGGEVKRHTANLLSYKYDALEEILKSCLGNPKNKAIIWCCWADCYEKLERVCDKVGEKFVALTGKTSLPDREDSIQKFQNDPEYRIMIANQQCAGIGINLTAANYCIYFAKTWNLEHDLQSEARSHRGGSEVHESITRIDIVTRGTIEEDIDKALKDKANTASLMLDIKRRCGNALPTTTGGGDEDETGTGTGNPGAISQ